jgi:putative glutamine amidotransferase
MKRRTFLELLVPCILLLAQGLGLPAQPLERAPDPLSPGEETIRLVVFDPVVSSIEALVALRGHGILDIPNLTVIGVYHVKQAGDFSASMKYVVEKQLAWFKFQVVSAEIREPDVFKKNACTPEFEAIVRQADGVIFFGGPDIPPSVFGRKTHLLTGIEDPYRHYFELSAIFHLLGGLQDDTFTPLLEARPGFPVLGICLGMQSLNVGTGGTLIQDIWAELYGKTYVEDVIALGPEQWHTNPYRRLFPRDQITGHNFHTIQFDARSPFCSAMGFTSSDHPRVLSSHHQAVDKIGKDLVVIATSRDGKIIEAVGHRKFPGVLGVQFHPEYPMLWETEPRFRQKPGDPLTSCHAILKGTPPSLEFNQAVWKWFAGKLVASHGN